MIKCPYCLGEIPNEAKKCRYCGEWIKDKPKNELISSVSGLFNKGKRIVQDKLEERKERRNAHLFIPDNSNPIEIKDVNFFGSYFTVGGKKSTYDKIVSLKFLESRRIINGIEDVDLTFEIFLDIGDNNFPLENRMFESKLDLSSSTFLFSRKKKQMEKTRMMYNILRKVTFERRLQHYYNMQRNLGYFHYPHGFKIYKNGDIQSGKKIRTNIFEAKKAELVEYGSFRRSGLKASTSNPYLCVIHKSKGLKIDLFGSIALYRNTSINVIYDKDVFDRMLRFSSFF